MMQPFFPLGLIATKKFGKKEGGLTLMRVHKKVDVKLEFNLRPKFQPTSACLPTSIPSECCCLMSAWLQIEERNQKRGGKRLLGEGAC